MCLVCSVVSNHWLVLFLVSTMGNIWSYFFPSLEASVPDPSSILLTEEEETIPTKTTEEDVLVEHVEEISTEESMVRLAEQLEPNTQKEEDITEIEEIEEEKIEDTIKTDDIGETEDGFEVIAEDDSALIMKKETPEPEKTPVDVPIASEDKDVESIEVKEDAEVQVKTEVKEEVKTEVLVQEEVDANPLAALKSGVEALIVELTPENEGKVEEKVEEKQEEAIEVKKENHIITSEDIAAQVEMKLEDIGIVEEVKDDSKEISVKTT